MTEKTCTHCGEMKPPEAFYRDKRVAKDGRAAECIECAKARQRARWVPRPRPILTPEHVAEVKEWKLVRVRANNVVRKQELRALVCRAKSENGCIRCGERDPAALDFHHVNQQEKSFQIGAFADKHSVAKVEAEIAKCVVLCANCHRKLHAGRFTVTLDGMITEIG